MRDDRNKNSEEARLRFMQRFEQVDPAGAAKFAERYDKKTAAPPDAGLTGESAKAAAAKRFWEKYEKYSPGQIASGSGISDTARVYDFSRSMTEKVQPVDPKLGLERVNTRISEIQNAPVMKDPLARFGNILNGEDPMSTNAEFNAYEKELKSLRAEQRKYNRMLSDKQAGAAQQKYFEGLSKIDLRAKEAELKAASEELRRAEQADVWNSLVNVATPELPELRKRYQQLHKDVYFAKQIQGAAGYNALLANPDFAEFAAKGRAVSNPDWSSPGIGGAGGMEAHGWKYLKEKAANPATFAQAGKFLGRSAGDKRDPFEFLTEKKSDELYEYMTAAETDIYSYLLAKNGREEAEKYAAFLKDALNARRGREIAGGVRANKNALLRAIHTGAYGAIAGFDQFGSGIKQSFSNEEQATSPIAYGSAAVREALRDRGPEILGSSAGQVAYDAITTTANMLPTILLSMGLGAAGAPAGIASAAGSAALGISASGNAYKQALSEGYNAEQARAYSVLVGASESTLQYALGGISKLGGGATNQILKRTVSNLDNAMLRIAAELGIKSLAEGTEEYLQEVLEPAFRNLIYDENNKISLVSEEGAYAFLLAVISTGLLEGGGTINEARANKKLGAELIKSNLTEQLKADALKMGMSTESYIIADKMKKGTLSENDSNAGRLYRKFAEEGGNLTPFEARLSEIAKERKQAEEKAREAYDTDEVDTSGIAPREGSGEDVLTDPNEDLGELSIRDVIRKSLEEAEKLRDAAARPIQRAEPEEATVKKINNQSRMLGNNGAKAMNEVFKSLPDRGSIDADVYIQNFNNVYFAGLGSVDYETITATGLTEKAKKTAYQAGRVDAAETMQDYTTLEKDITVVIGKTGTTYTNNMPVNFVWAVVPANSVITSTDVHGITNPAYPEELQPRDRERASSQTQISKISKQLKPELLVESPTAQNGAPIVRGDGAVVSGNARAEGIATAYARGTADAYREYIVNNAERFGLSTNAMPVNPVLVRIAQYSGDWAAIAREMNAATTASFSVTEQAMVDAKKMGNIIDLVVPNDEGNINNSDNKPFISAFVEAVVPETERGRMLTKAGLLSQAGLERAEYAIFAYAYEDTSLLSKLAESMENDSKNVTNALLSTAVHAVAVKNEIENGKLENLDVIGTVLSAAQIYADAKAMGKSVAAHTGQLSLTDSYTQTETKIAAYMEQNKRSTRKIRELLNAIYTAVESYGNPLQGSMFGSEAHDLDGAIADAFAAVTSETESGPEVINFEEASKNGQEIYHESKQRALGEDTGRADRGVVSGAESTEGRPQGVTAQRRRALCNVRELSRKSPQEIGADIGSKEKTIREIPADIVDVDAELRNISEQISEKGYTAHFFVGPAKTESGTAIGGVINDDTGEIWIWADSGGSENSATKIAEHELAHVELAQPGMVSTAAERLIEKYGAKEFEKILKTYANAYLDSIDVEGGVFDDTSGLTAGGLELFEEILADAAAGRNMFGEKASKYKNDVLQIFAERSSKAALGHGKEYAEARDRTTGPPVRGVKYSISKDLDSELNAVLNGSFDSVRNEVYIGDSSNFLTKVIGADALQNYISAEKAYQAMVSEETAKQAGRPTGENINYHNLGKDGLLDVLRAAETPFAAFADTPSLNNPRRDRIVIITNFEIGGGLGVVVQTMNAKSRRGGKRIESNKTITAYDKQNVAQAIKDAASDRRLLHFDIKRRPTPGAGGKGANYPTAIRQADLEYNIQQFWNGVNWEKQGVSEYTLPAQTTGVPEWKQQLAQFGQSQQQGLNQNNTKNKKKKSKLAMSEMQEHMQKIEDNINDYTRTKSRDEFVGTELMEKYGIKISGSIVEGYGMAKSISEFDKAKKKTIREVDKQLKKMQVTAEEHYLANGILNGTLSEKDIPAHLNADRVIEISEWLESKHSFDNDNTKYVINMAKADLDEKMDVLFKDSDSYESPSMMKLNYRSPQRIMRGIFGPRRGAEIYDAMFRPVAENEAERYRFLRRSTDQMRKFEDSKGKQTELTKKERSLAQRLLEFVAAADDVAKMPNREYYVAVAQNIARGHDASDSAREFGLNRFEMELAVRYAEWLQAKEESKNPEYDMVRVNNAIKAYREYYDDSYDMVNEFLAIHGYETIGFIKGYAPHMQDADKVNVLSKIMEHLGVNMGISELPTSIAGMTADFKPGKRWNPFFQPRTGSKTQYDIAAGFDSYVHFLSDILYHTDDIMRIRRAERHFRRKYAPERIRETLEWAEEHRFGSYAEKATMLINQGKLDAKTKYSNAAIDKAFDNYIEELYENIENMSKYSNFAMWLDNYANILAGKQTKADRGREYKMGRKWLAWGPKLVRTFGVAQIAGNVSTMINQVAQLPMIVAENGGVRTLKAVIDDITSGKVRRAAFAEQSDFLVGKLGVEYTAQTFKDKFYKAAFLGTEAVDMLMSTIAVRGAYYRALDNGMDHKAAIRFADDYGASVMASRMKGSKPLAFYEKGMVAQIMNLFQIEALNSWDHVASDLPAEFRQFAKEHGKPAASRKLAALIIKMLVAAFAVNRIAEEYYGGSPAPFDLMGLACLFTASGEGLTTNEWLKVMVDNACEGAGGERIFGTDEKDANKAFDAGRAFEDLGYNIMNEVPFARNISGLLGVGDQSLPLPGLNRGLKDVWEGGKKLIIEGDKEGGDRALSGAANTVLDVIPLGRQINKTVSGAKTVASGGRQKGYGERKTTQYAVDNNFENWVRGLLFGNAGLKETHEFYASGKSWLTAKQTGLLNELKAEGMEPKAAYNVIQEMRAAEKTEEQSRGYVQREMLINSNLSQKQKQLIYESMVSAGGQQDKIAAVLSSGRSFDDYMRLYNKKSEIDNLEITGNLKAAELQDWMTDQGYNKAQVQAAEEQFKFWHQMPASSDSFEKYVDAGLSEADAKKIMYALSNLKAPEGKESVTQLQRYQAALNSGVSVSVQFRALGVIMSDTEYEKAKIAYHDYGISPTYIVQFKELLDKIKDGSNISYADAKSALDRMIFLTDRQRAVLWQTVAKNWNARRNPYDVRIGEVVKKRLNG